MNGRENQVRVVLKRTENAYDSASFGPTGREHLSESSLSEIDRLIVKTSLAVIEEYDARIERLEAVEAEVSAPLR